MMERHLRLIGGQKKSKSEILSDIIFEQLTIFSANADHKLLVIAPNVYCIEHLRRALLKRLNDTQTEYRHHRNEVLVEDNKVVFLHPNYPAGKGYLPDFIYIENKDLIEADTLVAIYAMCQPVTSNNQAPILIETLSTDE